VCTGGGIRLISNRLYALDNITNWDMASGLGGITTLQQHFIYATANASNMPCTGKISRHQRLAGTNAAAIRDIVLPSGSLGSGSEISQCGNVGSGDPLLIDLVGNVVTVIGGNYMSLLNAGSSIVVNGTLTKAPILGIGAGWSFSQGGPNLIVNDLVNSTTPLAVVTGAGPSTALVAIGAVLGLSSSTTAARPSPTGFAAGAMWYDSTLKKPIWTDATVWRDATGTAV
jgi:hypothetical protein